MYNKHKSFKILLLATQSFIGFGSFYHLSEAMEPQEVVVKPKTVNLFNMPLAQRANYFLNQLKKDNPTVLIENVGDGTSTIWGLKFNFKYFFKRENKLIFCDVGITQIPKSIGALTNLTLLCLSKNNITELPSTIGYLINLTQLDLMYNKIKKLPNEILKCTKLDYLMLDNNELEDLPENLGSLVKLRTLALKNNNLKKVPPSIGMLTELRGLWIENNELTELPEEIYNIMGNLNRLLLNDNNISHLPFNYVYTEEGGDGCRIFIEGNPLAKLLEFPKPIVAFAK
jgi:hypothetical protein